MFKKFIVILLFTFSFSLYAQESSLRDDFYKKIVQQSELNKDISCDFTQLRKLKRIKEPVLSQGRFYYENTARMALIYKEPAGHKILMKEGNFVIVNSKETIKVSAKKNPFLEQVSYMMQACMLGDVSKFGKGWDLSIDLLDNVYLLELSPKKDSSISAYINSIEMIFNGADMTLLELKITEASGDYTTYTFFEKLINSGFDRSVFEE